MRRPNPGEALASLLSLSDGAERRASWRQAITALGQTGSGYGPPPLDGLDPEVLNRAAQLALDNGLADDLAWLGPGPAAVALYEISAALPSGRARRELGRRVFARVYEGTAGTFAIVAARMALGSGRTFEAATVRARIGLVLDMPTGAAVNPDPLALTITTARELRSQWLTPARTGTLHERRLAAKILEHAAREAVMRAQQGDAHPMRHLIEGEVREIFNQLLADREPLVWRHAATARGLLSAVAPEFQTEIEAGLDESLTPTQWRRAAVSLVASIPADPEQTLRACKRVIEGTIGKRDPGIAATLVLGLPRVIEAEPEAAEQLLDMVAATRRPDVAEAVASLLGDLTSPTFGRVSAMKLRATLASRAEGSASVLRTIADRSLRLIDGDSLDDEDDLVGALRRAMVEFENTGARAAFDLASKAAAKLHHALDFLENQDAHDEQVQPYLLGALSDVDACALERPRLAHLLLLGRRPGDTDRSVPELDRLYERLGRWLVDAEASAGETPGDAKSMGLAEQRHLKALLHLVDVESARSEDDTSVRERVRRTVQVLLRRVTESSGQLVHRIACATLARTCDAAVREGVCEPSDLLLTLMSTVTSPASFETLAEASTNLDVTSAIGAYAKFVSFQDSPESTTSPSEAALGAAERVIELSDGVGAGGSYRSEALRRLILKLGRCLESVALARGQAELVDVAGSGVQTLDELASAAAALNRLIRSANRRVLGPDPDEIHIVAEVPPLAALIERAVSSGVPPNSNQVSMAVSEIAADLPPALSDALRLAISGIERLPVAATSDVAAIPLGRRRENLPDWLLPGRTIGAFYVVRALGSGGAASVFVARRLEERSNPDGEGFALKVPDYDPTTARSLSEQEFLQLFREEAGALLSLPHHPNLARFVTFDLAARPKPILVMELIRGLSMDRLIRSRSLTIDRAFRYLDGIAAGLETMHGVGVGHLDLKPSNVILRDGETPVLVDFGLSGRHLRPGCGTLEFCAPEVLGIHDPSFRPTPQAADVYAFGCLAYELLAAETLFQAEGETAVLSLHVQHDGWPERVARLGRDSVLSDLGKFIASCLRRDARLRPTAGQARAALVPLAKKYQNLSWPLPLPVGRAQRAS
ncbi:MAG TPA: serine/threonine-protein kinase [Polyangiaceae bacterium]|nr:serine/threonine-protein kinase [Polyangiaceae bacterium]